MSFRTIAASLLVLVATVAASGGPASAAPPDSVFDRIDPGVRIASPSIRVALTSQGSEVAVSSSGGRLSMLDGRSGREMWPDRAQGAVRVVLVGGAGSSGGDLYRVQVGSFREEGQARELARRLESELAEPLRELTQGGSGGDVDVRWEPDRSVWRVRVGSSENRAALQSLLGVVRRSGYDDAWIASETRVASNPGRLRLVDPAWDVVDAGTDRIVFVAKSGGLVTVGGDPYRGLVEVYVGPSGELLTVNELNVEAYLRGVVPDELGPAAFPELEALKAQAVAARTYTHGNLGQFRAKGYDICDTPRCQVYGGAGSEHPLSDRAVRETRGEILTFGKEPVNAMYTSTCGGHTEDLQVVFPDMRGDYLRGVPCRPTDRELERRAVRVVGRDVSSAGALATTPVQGDELLGVARLVAHGVVGLEALDPVWRSEPASSATVAGWARAFADLAGRTTPGAEPAGGSRIELWRWIAPVLGRPGARPLSIDADALAGKIRARHPDMNASEARALADLIAEGTILLGPRGTLPADEPPTRGEVLSWLVKAADAYGAAGLRDARVASASTRGAISLREGRTERRWALEPGPLVLRRVGPAWYVADTIDLLPGDRLKIVGTEEGRARALELLAVEERVSDSDDRTSRRFRWTVTKTRRDLERSLSTTSPVGTLRSLRVVRRGVSGRVAELELSGAEGSAVVEGFRLRRALGLPEILFDVDLVHEPDGTLRLAVFRGRGWGHGVGMCQYGAFGMASRGESYREILTHYYSGVRVERAWR